MAAALTIDCIAFMRPCSSRSTLSIAYFTWLQLYLVLAWLTVLALRSLSTVRIAFFAWLQLCLVYAWLTIRARSSLSSVSVAHFA